MIRMQPLLVLSNIITCVALAVLPAGASVLYSTEFENFISGDDKWVDTEGWLGNSKGYGVHGIDQDAIVGGGLGKTAFLGLNQPSATLVVVAKPINYSPQAGDLPLVRVETLVGIQDSVTTSARDSFFVSIYNSSGGYLAGIRFDNRLDTYGIWRGDGKLDYDTGEGFARGDLHLLSFVINLPTNRWSADLDGIPLFANAPFTATTNTINFGLLAYEWQLDSTTPLGHGDNWMLIADVVVRSAPLGAEPFQLSSLTHTTATATATATLTWPGQKGFDYQIEYSDNLVTWRRDLPSASFPTILVDQPLTFQDATSGLPRRFYRVLRTETP
jgi:hypothetical protein